MKAILLSMMLLFACNISSCATADDIPENPPANNGVDNNNEDGDTSSPANLENMKLKITTGNRAITATLIDNPTTRDFITLMPLTVKLDDYADTEKIFYPSRKLSTQNVPSGIDPDLGDITYYSPWGNIAIFYKDYGYSGDLIRLAKIDSGIEVLQVSSSIENVRFELIKTEQLYSE